MHRPRPFSRLEQIVQDGDDEPRVLWSTVSSRSAVMDRALYLFVALACLAPAGVSAQDVTDLAPGSRVRVTMSDSLRQEVFLPRTRTVIGALSRATADTLWLHVGGPDTVRVPRTGLRAIDVSRGASRVVSAVEQAFVIAVGFGVPLYSAADDRDQRRQAVAIVGATAAVAAIIGAVRPAERWRRVR
jgi:hypothetical protein